MKQMVGRFAPTPSGRIHLGNLLCALVAWLSVRSQQGKMILRIEDLDIARCRKEYAEKLQEELLWFGLDWDEGGNKGGSHTPYEQSQCSALYKQALENLEKKGLLYPCFCSRAQLHAANAPHLSDGSYRYNGKCRSLTPSQRQELEKQKHPAMRVHVPDEVVEFTDLHYGHQQENLWQETGDFLLCRGDGIFAYQLAVVVDDLRMGVTQVVRGRDLLSSTPRQIWLAKQLGSSVYPEYGHIPLLLDSDGNRLSKRDGALSLDHLRQVYTPEQILGRLAFAANLIPKPETISAKELVGEFCWSKLPKEDILLPKGLF